MLKINSIEFIDSKNRVYKINKYQIESFPLIGGETANMITIKSWNQHGNTFIDSFMEAADSSIIFALYTGNKTDGQIEEMRRNLTNICNPLNGKIVMKITLSSSTVYKRDITFVNAPIFPIGFENRNSEWQKVQLNFEANNPFWYSDIEIIESFQSIEPLFIFPFELASSDPVFFGNVLPSNIAINQGQVEAPVNIRIVGACINPLIENLTTGEFIKFKNLTMVTGDILSIDTTFGQKKVTLNGENVFNKLDFSSTFFNLVIGENLIEFTDESEMNAATIHFIYRNLFITI